MPGLLYKCGVHSSAIPGVDFHFQNITNETRYFNFTISAGSTRSFPLTIIDDSIAEYYYERIRYYIGIYDSGQRLYCDSAQIYIDDNDGKLYTCSRDSLAMCKIVLYRAV